MPTTYAELRSAMDSGSATVESVVAIAERDVAIAAKILRLVNSVFFGVAGEITELPSAVKVLGALQRPTESAPRRKYTFPRDDC